MCRVPIRMLGNTESIALNHTVVADGREGIRWYEVRAPKGGAPAIYQQGTYAPSDSTTNPLWRWMGSVALDHVGDIGLGSARPVRTTFRRFGTRDGPPGIRSAR